jgi:hypothetical protein
MRNITKQLYHKCDDFLVLPTIWPMAFWIEFPRLTYNMTHGVLVRAIWSYLQYDPWRSGNLAPCYWRKPPLPESCPVSKQSSYSFHFVSIMSVTPQSFPFHQSYWILFLFQQKNYSMEIYVDMFEICKFENFFFFKLHLGMNCGIITDIHSFQFCLYFQPSQHLHYSYASNVFTTSEYF